MPRSNDGNEVFKYLTDMYKFVIASGSHGDTTTSSPTIKTAEVIDLTATTNFSANDYVFIIGSSAAEINALSGAPATSDSGLALPTSQAFETGARVVEATRINLGHLDEAGVTLTGALPLNPVNAATSRVPITYIPGQGSLGGSFNLRGWNNLNLQTVFGIPEAEAGTGAADDPYTAVISTTNIGTESTLAFRAVGVLIDGRIATVDFMGVVPAVNANIQVGGQQPATLAVPFNCTAIISRISAA